MCTSACSQFLNVVEQDKEGFLDNKSNWEHKNYVPLSLWHANSAMS